MAEGKETFLLNKNIVHLLDKMPDEMAGKLFKIIISYANNREVEIDDLILKIAFEPIRIEIEREWNKNNPGDLHWNWKGGISSVNKVIRNGARTKEWRKIVFERDMYTCQYCRKKGGILHAHHILSFANFPESRFDLDNGMTLCKKCHHQIHRKTK